MFDFKKGAALGTKVISSKAKRYFLIMKSQITLLLLFLSPLLYGQAKNGFNFTGGPTFPMGEFSEKNVDNIHSGYAQRGRVLNFTYSRIIKKDYSIQLSYLSMLNGMDNKPIIYDFLNRFPNVIAKVRGRSWTNSSILLGVARKFKLCESSFSVEPSALLGLNYSRQPELLILPNQRSNIYAEGSDESQAYSLGLMLSINNLYEISKKVSALISIDYFYTAPKFEFNYNPGFQYDEQSPNPPKAEKIEISYVQKMQLFMVKGGLRFSL